MTTSSKDVPKVTDELFKFRWKIENVSVWDYSEEVVSPSFVVEGLGNASFCLEWNNKGVRAGFCQLYLTRSSVDDGPKEVKVKYFIQIGDHSEKVQVISLKNNFGLGNRRLIENRRIFKKDDFHLLSGDITIECTIFGSHEIDSIAPKYDAWKYTKWLPLRIVHCSARTRLRFRTVSVAWDIENFSKLAAEDKVTTEIYSSPENFPLFLVTLFLTQGGENVQLNISNLDPKPEPTFVACKVSVNDVAGAPIVKTGKHVFPSRVPEQEDTGPVENKDSEKGEVSEKNEKKENFEKEANSEKDENSEDAIWSLTVLVLKKELTSKKKALLPRDTLSLLLKFKVSDGVQFSEIEETDWVSKDAEKPRIKELSQAKQNCLNLFKGQRFCDITFETSTRSIGSHKFVLCSNSLVFQAMFEHDGLEKDTNTVRVTDIGFETLERFLAYLYTKRLEGEVDLRAAIELYYAADKYQVESLKSEVSCILRNHLSVENVCDVLSLADRHKDEDLADSAKAFVAKCKARVLGSKEWKELFDDNPKLAAEVLRWLCLESP